MIIKLFILFVITGALSQELHHSTPQNRVVQKSFLDDPKSWISPNDGNLATENTPIYGIQRKPKFFGNGAVEYKIVKFKNSSEAENSIPSTTAKPEPEKDMNTLIEEMLRKSFPNSGSSSNNNTKTFFAEKDGFPNLEYAPNKIDGHNVTRPVGEWLYNHQETFPLDSYDIAVTLTANGMWRKASGTEILLDGIAYPSGSCKVFHDHQLVVKTVLVTEKGNFHGIQAGAHEIGHSLGIDDHDDQLDKGCPKDAGTIISPSTKLNGFKWSQCSLDFLTQTFVNSTHLKKTECLYNKPKGGESVPRLMPGKMLNANKQCHLNEKNTFVDFTLAENICEHLVCRSHEDSFGHYVRTTYEIGATIGSTCGQDKICLLGNCVELHHHMTPEERQQVFYTDGTDVPPYEVVTIHSSRIEKRDVNAGHVFEVSAYGNNVKAWITPTEGILAGVNTPICGVRSRRDGGIDIYKYPNKMKEIEATVFKNTNQGITMTVNYRSDGTIMMNGIVGSKNWYVKPVPERLTNSISRYRRSVNNIKSDYEDKSYHIVYQIPMTSNNSTLMAPLTQSKKSKRAITFPSIIYPEVLVILDWGLYQQLGGTIESAVPYLLSFWNGVDLKYRGLQNPRYRLNIAAIFLPENSNALSFIQKSISYGPTSLDSQSVIQHSARWLFDHQRIIPLNEYDVAVILTNRRMFTNENGRPSYGLGRAWISGACSTHDQYGVHRSAVVHDEGTFGGIHATAHELGHLFGANHDGIEHPNCPTHVGTIMAVHPILNTEYSYSWSWCSQNDFSRFLNYYNPTCLYNVPNPGTPVPRLLPGKMMNAHQQCSMINRNTQAYINTDICKKLVCYDVARRVWYNNVDWSAADGTYCAPGRMCLYGKCVNEN
ncbi:hypothetical protein KQX54_012709 [Cotesia glomerata]|uniref:Peptidase M12B domain-containing protein n=1 Tax=Cotesia glomerata TaxID=32391 RepID=A0AAV7J3L5_COTGL|nr:hypothetical protein KQX54_012709 [Cotesia glomerata]